MSEPPAGSGVRLTDAAQRLYGLSAWRETPYFTDRERAALAFTEKVTLVAADHVPATALALSSGRPASDRHGWVAVRA